MAKKEIRLLVMDVDGTLTDGKIYMSEHGEIFKAFDIKDGYGIHDILPKAGITPIIITGRVSQIVVRRCQELGIKHIYQGCLDKAEILNRVAADFGIEPDRNGVYQQIAYIGDDLNDLKCMQLCGIAGCPSDAAYEVKRHAHFIAANNGGGGAVRGFIEQICGKEQ